MVSEQAFMAVLTDDRFGILYGNRKVARELGHDARRLARKTTSRVHGYSPFIT